MLITIGINSNGYREILGADMAVAGSEDKKTIRYIKRLVGLDLLDDVQISISTPQPGTPFYNWVKNNNYLNFKKFNNFDGGLNSVVDYPHYSASQIINMKVLALRTRDRETLKRKFKEEKLLVGLKNLYRKYGAIKLGLKLFKRLCSELKFSVSLTRFR